MGRLATEYKIVVCQTVGNWYSSVHLMPLSHGLKLYSQILMTAGVVYRSISHDVQWIKPYW